MIKKYKKPIVLILVFLGLLFFVLIILISSRKTIEIPPENSQKTMAWKVYENKEYRFSFKYPEGLLSNFQDKVGTPMTTTRSQIAETKKLFDSKNSDPNAYNVIFQSNAWKSEDTLDAFIKSNLPETKNLDKQKLLINKIRGFRITNIGIHSDLYFYYNIFKNANYIYNFAIFSDNPNLIRGNTQLLENIISTAKFTN